MNNGLHTIGFEVAEQEAEDLPEYYFYNDYYQKASIFSKEHKELFFIGRTGSGKSAILEMIRRKKGDSSRVISITEEDFAVQILLSSQEVSAIPTQYRNLAFKTLWKYVIIVNILKTIYGNDYKWTNFIHGDSKEAHELLNRFGELTKEQRTFTDQVISFLQRIQEISIENIGGIKTGSGDTKSDLYNLFKVLNNFECHQLKDHVSKKYLYVLIDDLDKNWSGSKENVDLIRALFDCIVEIGTKFYGDIKFVVALRTDIFRQLDFHQTEKIRPYVVEIRWYNWQLQKIIESRLTSYWQGTLKESLSRFPSKIKEVDVFDFFIRRTMRRPRDIINFINLCINEANMRSASSISEKDISAAEKQYSRFRIEALVDEWKYIYPDLEKWIDLFAGNQFIINYADLRVILEHENKPIKEIIDILYEVGFLGYRSPEDDEVKFSFISKGAPGFDHKYHVHVAFFSYLNERAEELGRTKCSQEESFPPQI